MEEKFLSKMKFCISFLFSAGYICVKNLRKSCLIPIPTVTYNITYAPTLWHK